MRRMTVLLALVAGLFFSGEALAQTTSGSWQAAPNSGTAATSVAKAGQLFWGFDSGDTDSVMVGCRSTTCVMCLNANADADGTGAAAYYARYQPEGGTPDFDDSFRVTESGVDVVLSTAKECIAVSRGNYFMERSVACDATTCYVSILGRD